VSRLHQVLSVPAPGLLDVEDVDGAVHRVSLLTLDGPIPRPGDWLIVHSGYAIERVDRAGAEAVVAELRSRSV
jgi:hydrogenase expression/formation protein HypC